MLKNNVGWVRCLPVINPVGDQRRLSSARRPGNEQRSGIGAGYPLIERAEIGFAADIQAPADARIRAVQQGGFIKLIWRVGLRKPCVQQGV